MVNDQAAVVPRLLASCLLAGTVFAQAAQPGVDAPSQCEGTTLAGLSSPVPADPYPVMAAGWGPEAGGGLMVSRWAEDWTGMASVGHAKPMKALAVGGGASLTLSAEARLRADALHQGLLVNGNDFEQTLFRGVIGAALQVNPVLGLYGEVATGQVEGHRATAPANFQNKAALQQLFMDLRTRSGDTLVGAMLGRQEFSDGPRQLISLSDGPNLHRTWNGVRVYAHRAGFRAGAFDLRVTRPMGGSFDETVNKAERLQGVNASLIVSSGAGPNTYLEPFWIHSEKPDFRAGGAAGPDHRDTWGMRLWGRQGDVRYDWTLARQTGRSAGRPVDAWGLFAVQSLQLSETGWKPRLTSHLDIASGGGQGATSVKAFNPLYASSNYLGEGQFLSLSNLLLVAPGLAVSPAQGTHLAVEYGFAHRLSAGDPAYAGGMRPYAGSQGLSGKHIGGLLRVTGSWSAAEQLTLFINYEHLAAGDLLRRAGLPSGSYTSIGATYRY